MKLIIDIPKATYDYWKEHKDDYVLSEAIANAIPYDDSGDLISRSALKEYVKKVEDYESAYTICAYIDNAPTVEPICPYLSDNEVKQPCLNSPCERPQDDLISRSALLNQIDTTDWSDVRLLVEDAPTVEPKRPQGEWVIDGHHIRCNRCNEYICNTDREGNKIPDNFCPHCGADMRKGGAE